MPFQSWNDAIGFYHSLLASKYLESTREILETSVQERKLTFGGRSTCTVLRPFFISNQAYEAIRFSARIVSFAIGRLYELLLNDAGLRKELSLNAAEEEIIRVPTGYGAPDVSARLDGFLSSSHEFHFVEYNADSPGGIGFGDALSEVFLGMPIMRDFFPRYAIKTVPVRDRVIENLLQAFRRWGGKNRPNIAIIDWKNASTYNEFLLMKEHFERKGLSAEIADPDEVELINGKLTIRDFHIDLIYKRVLVGELLQKYGMRHAIIRAAQERAVCVVNGFGVQILFKKMIFAFLSDPKYTKQFDPETQMHLSRCIPWTRKVCESKTLHEDKIIDLIPFVSRHKSQLVLKPNGEYGGRGVVLGWQSDQNDWDRTLQSALDSDYVVQQRVPISSEVYPLLRDNKLMFESRYFDIDPYIWNGNSSEGCGIRLSRSPLLNVSAGGGSAVPLMIVEPVGGK